MSPEQHRQLAAWIATQLPDATDVQISTMRPPSSGASNLTELFDLSYREGGEKHEPLVLRTLANGPGLFPEYDLGLQAGVMRALSPTPVPVPQVRWYETDLSVIGSPFIVMQRIDGATPSDAAPGFHGHGLFAETAVPERPQLWWAALEAILQVQALDWRALPLPRLVGMASSTRESTAQHLALFRSYLSWAALPPVPIVEKGLAWLAAAAPPNGPLVLTWGDARPGNIFYKNGEVVGLLDWELAAVGVPEADVAYLIWSAEHLAEVNHTPRLTGLPEREETWARYVAISGQSEGRIQYGEIFALLRLSVMIVLGMAKGGARSAEALNNSVIGRALSSAMSLTEG